ncbi:MAG: hypothetical protein ABI634_14745 [Acidobacteriota bacterium]
MRKKGSARVGRRARLARLPLLLVLVALPSLALLGACRGTVSIPNETLARDDRFAWTPRNHVRAFYSGHSLSEGVPEAVARTAAARGQTLEFEFQNIGYSLLRERTKGQNRSGQVWDGYRAGNNRTGSGLDVAQELERPSRLEPGQRYDALVVTERHDLPWAAAREGTATYLADMARHAWQGNPQADVFFYHTWLALDRNAPVPWITYERHAQRLWECVASRANLDLAPPLPRIRVLPGGTALADLVELLWQDKVPGLSAMTRSARVGLLFADDVHLSAVGKHYMGLVHYAFLFGQTPTGGPLVPPLTSETTSFLENFAGQTATTYARTANAAAQRDMEACRVFAASEMSGANSALPARGWRDWLERPYRNWVSRRVYSDPNAPDNPFRRRQ